MSKLRILVTGLILGLLAAALAPRAEAAATRWSDETIAELSRIPIQDQGRIKPFSTFAIFELVKVNGRMTCTSPEGDKVSAMYWMLDSLFNPDVAVQYPVILIENPEVMQALGLDDKEKRARFTVAQLEPHAEQLFNLAKQYDQIDEKERTLFQNQILNLYDSYATCQNLLHAMDFARFHEVVKAGTPMAGMLDAIGLKPNSGEDYHFRYSTMLYDLPKLLAIYQAQVKELGQEKADKSDVMALLSQFDHISQNSDTLTVIPPVTDLNEATWFSPGSLLGYLTKATTFPEREVGAVVDMENVYDAATAQPEALEQTATTLVARLKGAAVERGQYEHIPLEIFFYRAKFFYWSLIFFVLSAVIVAVSWTMPRKRWMANVAWVSVLIPTLLLLAGITVRCIIRGRPPVTSLYETTLFIPAVAIVVALAAEWISRRKIALSVAAGLGCLGMFLAHNYELQGPDTMQSMIAVLNSNFWLSTHVTTVTIGYSAGLLACAIGHIYIIGRALGFGARNRDFFRSTTKLTYGVICFGALFAFVGTVLGGVWANNSWGRFWGWDPKENGALLIILWFLFILHARLGGYIRDLGIAVCAVIGGIIVSFSWWGVNLLSIGLHSYGFISGVSGRLHAYWGLECAVLAVAVVAHYRAKAEKLAGQSPRARTRAEKTAPRGGGAGRVPKPQAAGPAARVDLD